MSTASRDSGGDRSRAIGPGIGSHARPSRRLKTKIARRNLTEASRRCARKHNLEGESTMKKLTTILAAMVAIGLGSSAATAQTLRFGHANSPGEVAHDLFNEFAERVSNRTGGKLTIRVFPSEQLGKEADLVQQIK